MPVKEFYEKWDAEVENLKNKLLARESLLRQYAIWLEASEENTVYHGKDIRDMLEGAMQVLSDIDFIPGIGWENFVVVAGEAQRKADLDLGVCPFLEDNVRNSMRARYLREKVGETLPICRAIDGLYVGSLDCCIPPGRSECEHRIRKLEESVEGIRPGTPEIGLRLGESPVEGMPIGIYFKLRGLPRNQG